MVKGTSFIINVQIKIISACIASLRTLHETPCMRDDRTSRLRSSMIQTSDRQCPEFPRFLTLFFFFCARFGAARRCAPKLRRQKTSVRFDSIEGTRSAFFSSFLARYRVIMTAL